MPSKLPPEIEDEIFEFAARTFPGDALNLSIVSKRIQDRVERIIYETLFLAEDVEEERFSDTACIQRILPALEKRPAEFFAERVKNVCLPFYTPLPVGNLILAKCSRIKHLALWLRPTTEALPWFPPLTHTLESLITDTLLLKELYKAGFVFPKITFMLICEHTKEDFPSISTFAWLPELKIILMDPPPFKIKDLDVLVYTALKLKTMFLNVQLRAVDEVFRWRKELTRKIDVRINDNCIAHRRTQTLWRMAYEAIDIDDLNRELKF